MSKLGGKGWLWFIISLKNKIVITCMYNWKYLKKQEIKVVLQDWHIIIVLVYVNVFVRDGAVYCT